MSLHRFAAKATALLTLVGLLWVHSESFGQNVPPPTENFQRILAEFQNPESDQVLVFAHRGGWRNEREHNAPENSIANLQKAIRMGFDGFETDVAKTKDGHLVIMHDPTVDRTTSGSGPIGEMTLDDVKKLFLKFKGATKPTKQRVPTFRELLENGKNQILFKVDLKCGVECLPNVLKEIDDVGSLNQVLVRIGYNAKNAAFVKKTIDANPRWKNAIILFRCRATKYVQNAIDQFHPPVIEILNAEKGLTDDMRAMAKLIMESPARIEAHSSKESADWQAQVDLGMRALHTTKPRELLAWLKERNLHW